MAFQFESVLNNGGGGSSSTILTETLSTGGTSVTFTGIPTSGNYVVSFYTSNGTNYKSIDVTSTPGTAVLGFTAQSSPITVACKIEEV